jgi:hypothetical protein
MDEEELQKLIEQLHAEIQNTQDIDEPEQQLLQHLDSDIHELLGRSEDDHAQALSTTIRRLEESLDHFEVTHPALTSLISRLLESLSTAGI